MAISIGTLDPVSRRQLQVFGFKLLMMIPFSVALSTRGGFPLLATISSFCFWYSVFSGLLALFQRQRHNSAFLTNWDEMAAFLGLAVLMRLVDIVTA